MISGHHNYWCITAESFKYTPATTPIYSSPSIWSTTTAVIVYSVIDTTGNTIVVHYPLHLQVFVSKLELDPNGMYKKKKIENFLMYYHF